MVTIMFTYVKSHLILSSKLTTISFVHVIRIIKNEKEPKIKVN